MINLIAAELIRFRSTKIWLIALLAALATGGLPGLIALIGPENSDPPMPGLDTAEGVGFALGLVSLMVFAPAVLGTVAITSEYRHRTITPTFLFAPRRSTVAAAKLITYGVIGLCYGLIVGITGTAGLYLGALIKGGTLGLTLPAIAGLMLRIAVAMAAYTLIGVGIGALIRNQVIALGVVIGYFYLVETMLLLIPGVKIIYPILPGGATSALTNFSYLADATAAELGGGTIQLLPPALGALVLAAYAIAATGVAIAVPLRRDVT